MVPSDAPDPHLWGQADRVPGSAPLLKQHQDSTQGSAPQRGHLTLRDLRQISFILRVSISLYYANYSPEEK